MGRQNIHMAFEGSGKYIIAFKHIIGSNIRQISIGMRNIKGRIGKPSKKDIAR
jgi:hypothetical protein